MQVSVELRDRTYDVHVVPGDLAGLGAAMARLRRPGHCVIVSNDVVAPIYAEAARRSLEGVGFTVQALEIPDGEEHKTLQTWASLVDALLSVGVDRESVVVALGGGVTGDIVGFAASSALRGLPLVQVPTTLLAMVDSSVGGKTGVNTRQGKNLVGSFYQPTLVWAAMSVLATLPEAEWRCGLGEALKAGVILDARLVEYMVEHAALLRARDPEATGHVVRRCVEIKASVVSADERESGWRSVLNFGHTVGHAVERALGYGVLRHGEAVAIGMLAEARYAATRGWCPSDVPGRIAHALDSVGLPTRVPVDLCAGREEALSSALLEAAHADKKMARGFLNLYVPADLGRMRPERLSPADLAALFAVLEVSAPHLEA